MCGLVLFFFSCDCSNPALLPSGRLSVSRAAEERHSRGCLEKSGHMLSPALTLAVLPACFPAPSLSHVNKQIHTQVARL